MTDEQNLWGGEQTARDLRFYLAAARRPLLIGLGAILFFYLLSLISFWGWSQSSLNYVGWLISALVILVVCLKVASCRFNELAHAATAGVLVGIVIGAWQAILGIVWFWSWWRLLDLVVEPLATALVGLVLGLMAAKIFQVKNR